MSPISLSPKTSFETKKMIAFAFLQILSIYCICYSPFLSQLQGKISLNGINFVRMRVIVFSRPTLVRNVLVNHMKNWMKYFKNLKLVPSSKFDKF